MQKVDLYYADEVEWREVPDLTIHVSQLHYIKRAISDAQYELETNGVIRANRILEGLKDRVQEMYESRPRVDGVPL